MFDIVLFEPEIPPNTGNVIRLCANTGCRLHLVEPLGFSLEEKAMRRAGLDYHEMTALQTHASLEACLERLSTDREPRIFALTTKGRRRHSDVRWQAGDVMLFGPESRGLPASVLGDARLADRLRLPMQGGSRSLNLSNSVAVVVYEAWRQLDYSGGC